VLSARGVCWGRERFRTQNHAMSRYHTSSALLRLQVLTLETCSSDCAWGVMRRNAKLAVLYEAALALFSCSLVLSGSCFSNHRISEGEFENDVSDGSCVDNN
jgi:hypothetical protein